MTRARREGTHMSKQHYTIIAITSAIVIAGVLIFLLRSGGQPDMPFLSALVIVPALLIVFIGVMLYFRKPGTQAGQPQKPARYAVGLAILGAVMAQMGSVLPQMFDGKHDDGSTPWIIVASVFAAVGAIIAGVSGKNNKQAAPGRNASVPWVVALIMVMVVLGIGGTIVAIAAAPSSGGDSASIAVPIIGMIVMLLVAVMVFKIFITGTRTSAYALPDVLPAAGPPTDPQFVRGGYWDGTKLLNQRVWGIPVPVTGRGYFIQGQGKVWLADEVLAFHLYMTRNPLVIPYGIIHSINTKKLILRKNHFPGPGMSIIWGRPDMPMVTTIQVTQNKAENELWAQEIMRRAVEWKDKLAATQAEGAV